MLHCVGYKVVNIKVVNIRKYKYNNLKEQMNDKSNIHIGRCRIIFINRARH